MKRAWIHGARAAAAVLFGLLALAPTAGAQDLDDLEMPVIAVAARASDGETAYLTSSLAGRACMASGSLPPMVPTYVRNRRLLDMVIAARRPPVILLQEVNARPGWRHLPSGYKLLASSERAGRSGGGTAIVVHQSFWSYARELPLD